MVSASPVTWATSVPILVFLGLSVLELSPIYATHRRQTDRRQTKASLNASVLWGRRHNKYVVSITLLTPMHCVAHAGRQSRAATASNYTSVSLRTA